MDSQQKKYEEVLREALNNPEIIGLFWGGSRGKSEQFVTKDSDMDVYVILSDDVLEHVRDEFAKYNSTDFEIRVYTLSQFKDYSAWGSEREWDRYNFSHNKATIDKTGEIQKTLDEKGLLPKNVRQKVVEDALDDYINQVYRSAKYFRDGNSLSAYLDATESMPPLMTAMYALEGRIKPYNKYFEWELENYPLALLPWPQKEFIADYKHLLETGDLSTQEKLFREIKKLFIEQDFKKIFDD